MYPRKKYIITALACLTVGTAIRSTSYAIALDTQTPTNAAPTLEETDIESFEATVGSKVFQTLQNTVFQIKTAFSPEAAKSSYGSGFVINTAGLLITNFHVIEDAINSNGQSKVFVLIDQNPVAAEIIAVDIIHDLALIKVPQTFNKSIALATHMPKPGDTIYSIGTPKDLNLSIIEGIYNQIVKETIFDSIHISSPLNAGMSGGPTVNKNGDLVGVNSAVLRRAQNISFSIPSIHIRKLLAHATHAPFKTSEQFYTMAQQQLLIAQNEMTHILIKDIKPTFLFDYKIPDFSKHLKCWSDDRNETPKERYKDKFSADFIYHECFLNSRAVPIADLAMTDIHVNFQVLKNRSLSLFHYFFNLGSLYENLIRSDRDYPHKNEDYTTDYICRHEIVERQEPREMFKASTCLRSYLPFKNLYQVWFKASTLHLNGVNILFSLNMNGFSRQNIQNVIDLFFKFIQKEVPKKHK